MISVSNTTNFRQSLGKMGEAVAADFLISNDWQLEARNYYVHRRGEIDIIGRPPPGQVLAFVEVKTRQLRASDRGLDHPGQQSMHWAKQRRMSRTAASYLHDPAVTNRPSILRFDLILVDIRLNYGDLRLLLLRDVQALKPHCLVTHLTNIMGTF